MYIALEYVTYVVVAVLLGAFVFATSVLLLLSQEGAKHLVHTSRKVAERTVHLAAATAESPSAVNTLIKRESLTAVKLEGWPRIIRLRRRAPKVSPAA